MKRLTFVLFMIFLISGTTQLLNGQTIQSDSEIQTNSQGKDISLSQQGFSSAAEFVEIASNTVIGFPGNTYIMTATIHNHCPLALDSLFCRIVSPSPYLTIYPSIKYIGNLDQNESTTVSFTVEISVWLVEYDIIKNEILVFSDSGIHGSGENHLLIPENYSNCASTQTEDEYIARVEFGSIDNPSGWQGGVADYTHLYTVLNPDTAQSILVTNGNPWANDQVRAWVDWNRMDCFCDETPYILENINGTGEYFSGEIFVPEGQGLGPYRMRIRMTYGSSPPLPGGTSTYGEIEDYTVIVGEFPSMPPPDSLIYIVGGNNVYLSWTTPKALNVRGYLLYRDNGTIGDWQTSTTFSDPDLQPGSYWYSVSVLYPEGESEKSDPILVEIDHENATPLRLNNIAHNGSTRAVSIFPNPALQNVTIEAPYLKVVKIYNLSGDLILSKQAGDSNLTIDLENLQSGVYLVHSFFGEEKTITRLIVNH